MSEYQILHAEPRYKVDDFVDEVLGRWELVERELHSQLLFLVRGLAESILKLAEGNPRINGRIDSIAWLEDGKLLICLATDGTDYAAEREPHQLDRYVNSALEAWPKVPVGLRREIADLLRGFVTQLGVIAKHNPAVRLRRITFGMPQLGQSEHARRRSRGDDKIEIQLFHEDRPFGPREARWN